jgi:hypothetical protein
VTGIKLFRLQKSIIRSENAGPARGDEPSGSYLQGFAPGSLPAFAKATGRQAACG